MKDRSVEYPNRYRMTLVPGTTDIYEMTPVPGEVYEEGTLMSKANILDDDSEMDIWGTIGDRTPNDAFSFIGKILAEHDKVIANLAATLEGKIVTGTYTGNGTASRTISLGFTPKAVLVTPKTAGHIVAGNNEGAFTTVAFAITGVNSVHMNSNSYNVLAITNDGFTVSYIRNNDLSPRVYVESNSNGRVYNYIAIA